MATKVKDTPVLTGKDAERFHKTTKDNANKKVSAEKYQRAKLNFSRFNQGNNHNV